MLEELRASEDPTVMCLDAADRSETSRGARRALTFRWFPFLSSLDRDAT